METKIIKCEIVECKNEATVIKYGKIICEQCEDDVFSSFPVYFDGIRGLELIRECEKNAK